MSRYLKIPLSLHERAVTQSTLKCGKPAWPWAFPNRQSTEPQHQCYRLLPTTLTMPHILSLEVRAQVPLLPFHELETQKLDTPPPPNFALPRFIRHMINIWGGGGGQSESTESSEVAWRVRLIGTFDPEVDVTINGKLHLHCLINMGAQISVINRSHWRGTLPSRSVVVHGLTGPPSALPVVTVKCDFPNGCTA